MLPSLKASKILQNTANLVDRPWAGCYNEGWRKNGTEEDNYTGGI